MFIVDNIYDYTCIYYHLIFLRSRCGGNNGCIGTHSGRTGGGCGGGVCYCSGDGEEKKQELPLPTNEVQRSGRRRRGLIWDHITHPAPS